MNTFRFLRAFFFVFCLTLQHPSVAQQNAAPRAICQVYFSPRGAATSAIIENLEDAKSTILVQAYSFTSLPIAEALVRAHERGVEVQVLLDKSQRTQGYTAASLLAKAAIPTSIDAAHAIAHNKVIIIDNETVFTGSFNFTKAAEERNAENLLVIHDDQLAARYIENWRFHHAHSVPFSRMTKDNQHLSSPAMRPRSRD